MMTMELRQPTRWKQGDGHGHDDMLVGLKTGRSRKQEAKETRPEDGTVTEGNLDWSSRHHTMMTSSGPQGSR